MRYTRFNLLTPNVNYSGRTAPLTSKVVFYIFIQHIKGQSKKKPNLFNLNLLLYLQLNQTCLLQSTPLYC